MKTHHSHIFKLSEVETAPGICGICGKAVTLRYRDESAVLRLGECCLRFAVLADQVLNQDIGLRAPTFDELARGIVPDH